MNILNVSDKTKLENGDDYYLIEKTILNENLESNQNIKVNNNSGFTIKIGTIRRPTSTATIFLIRDDDYVGHISANLYSNGTASLIMSGINSVELPSELEMYREIIEKHDTALLVDEKYRRQGKASLLIKLMFQYLDKKGIRDLEVDGIADDIASKLI